MGVWGDGGVKSTDSGQDKEKNKKDKQGDISRGAGDAARDVAYDAGYTGPSADDLKDALVPRDEAGWTYNKSKGFWGALAGLFSPAPGGLATGLASGLETKPKSALGYEFGSKTAPSQPTTSDRNDSLRALPGAMNQAVKPAEPPAFDYFTYIPRKPQGYASTILGGGLGPTFPTKKYLGA